MSICAEKHYGNESKQIGMVVPDCFVKQKNVPVAHDVNQTAQSVEKTHHYPKSSYMILFEVLLQLNKE